MLSAVREPVKEDVCVGANGSVVVLKVGAVGGSVTLVGRPAVPGEWDFARITNDQTEALLGETGDGVVRAPPLEILEWVASWEEGLQLMDRYPWVRLHPVAVHPEFVERVRVAVEERLTGAPQDPAVERERGKWERLLGRSGMQSREREVRWQS